MTAPHEQPYQRVDAARLSAREPTGPTPQGPAGPGAPGMEAAGAAGMGAAGAGADGPDALGAPGAAAGVSVRWWIIPLSVLLCTAQAVVTIMATHLSRVTLTPTLISVVAFGTLFALVLVLNPLVRAVFRERLVRSLRRAELACVFTAMLVTSGISTFGLADQLVPMVAAPWNEEWNTAQRGWSEQVLPNLNPSLYISAHEGASPEAQADALQHIRVFREGLRPVDADGETLSPPMEDASFGDRLGYWYALFEQIPWAAWIAPLAGWMVFIGACYAMFYCLTYVVLESWINREKLIFPLAQLPEQLLPEDQDRWLPRTLRTSGFWLAFAVVLGVWSWNGAVAADWLPGLGRINLGMSRQGVEAIVSGTIFEGLTGGRHELQFLIIFTAIGVAFLLPTEISFSLWFYFLVGKAIILALVWLGYGQTGADFPTDNSWANNTVTAQAGGGLFMFAAICLGRALLDFVRLGRGRSAGEKLRLSVPLIGLVISLGVMFGWLLWNDLPVIWALVVTAVLTLATLALMRVVAEGGVYWFQLHTSPLHLYQVFGLGAVLKPAAAVAPLLPMYWMLFWDAKTFLAPNLANAAKMREDTRASRAKFHINIVLCIIVSVVVALGFTVFLAHLIGAQQMHSWFYSSGPQMIFNDARDLAAAEPGIEWGNAFSYVFGAAFVAFSMFIRSVLFWFPHPIGYVLLTSPLMAQLWFSFFLGWIAKKLVVKYGGKQTFDQTRPIFIGVIMGELIAIFIWAILGITYEFQPGVSLNRYGP